MAVRYVVRTYLMLSMRVCDKQSPRDDVEGLYATGGEWVLVQQTYTNTHTLERLVSVSGVLHMR